MHANPLNQPPGGHQPHHPPVGHPPQYPGAQAPYPGAPPPQQGYAPPMASPYAPPAFDYQPIQTYEQEGSYGLGIAAGLVFSLIGLIIAHVAGKPQTKRGATHGFLIRLGITGFVIFIALLST